jgi:hypothetical protein
MVTLIKEYGDGLRKFKKLLNQYEQNKVKTEKFRNLVYGYSRYLNAVKGQYDFELEQRLNELEEKLGEKS